jgi:hypothetical protein
VGFRAHVNRRGVVKSSEVKHTENGAARNDNFLSWAMILLDFSEVPGFMHFLCVDSKTLQILCNFKAFLRQVGKPLD